MPHQVAQNPAARSAAVFSLSAKKTQGGVHQPPPIRARVRAGATGGAAGAAAPPPQLPAGPLFTEFAGMKIWRQKVMVTVCMYLKSVRGSWSVRNSWSVRGPGPGRPEGPDRPEGPGRPDDNYQSESPGRPEGPGRPKGPSQPEYNYRSEGLDPWLTRGPWLVKGPWPAIGPWSAGGQLYQ